MVIDNIKVTTNNTQEQKSDKYPSKRERKIPTTFRLSEVVSVRLVSDPNKMDKKVISSILRHAG